MMASLLAMLSASSALAPAFQAPAPASQATHPLTGRQIAHVMGYTGADWLERPERESEENVQGALDAI
jgi:hypothetical protein